MHLPNPGVEPLAQPAAVDAAPSYRVREYFAAHLAQVNVRDRLVKGIIKVPPSETEDQGLVRSACGNDGHVVCQAACRGDIRQNDGGSAIGRAGAPSGPE